MPAELLDEIDDPLPPRISDSKRKLDLIIRDHAHEAWGELRGIDKLDSAKAELILVGVMGKLVGALPVQKAGK